MAATGINSGDTKAFKLGDVAQGMGCTQGNLLRWLALGRKRQDPCPLLEPEKVPAWYYRHFAKTPPAYLTRWAAKAGTSVAGSGVPDDKDEPPTDILSADGKLDLTKLEGLGLESAVPILRRAVEATGIKLMRAYVDGEDMEIDRVQIRYEKACEQLSKSEKALLVVMTGRGDLAPRSEFRTDLVALAGALRGMRRVMAKNIVAGMRKIMGDALTPEIEAALRTCIEEERLREDAQLRTMKDWVSVDGDGEADGAATP